MRIFFFIAMLTAAGHGMPALAFSGLLGKATAEVADAIKIKGKKALIFGHIESAKGSGKIIVPPNDNPQIVGRITLQGGRPSPARFQIVGKPGASYKITLPKELVFPQKGAKPDEKGNPPPGLQVVRLQSFSMNQRTITTKAKLDQNGKDTILVGGTLIVPASVAPGLYSGEVPLTVSY